MRAYANPAAHAFLITRDIRCGKMRYGGRADTCAQQPPEEEAAARTWPGSEQDILFDRHGSCRDLGHGFLLRTTTTAAARFPLTAVACVYTRGRGRRLREAARGNANRWFHGVRVGSKRRGAGEQSVGLGEGRRFRRRSALMRDIRLGRHGECTRTKKKKPGHDSDRSRVRSNVPWKKVLRCYVCIVF